MVKYASNEDLQVLEELETVYKRGWVTKPKYDELRKTLYVSSKRICLVICFYNGDGERAGNQESTPVERFMETQKECLKRYENNIDEVFFVISEDHRKETKVVRNKEGNISYIYRPNFGLSFGGWADTYDLFKDEFDYFLFGEDDYCFVKDNFDQIMVDEYEALGYEYLTTYKENIAPGSQFWPGFISTVGLLSNRVVSQFNWWDRFLNQEKIFMQQRGDYMGSTMTLDMINESGEITGPCHSQKSFHMAAWLSGFGGGPDRTDGHPHLVNSDGSIRARQSAANESISCLSTGHSCFLYWNWANKTVEAFNWERGKTTEENMDRVLLACYQWVTAECNDLRVNTWI